MSILTVPPRMRVKGTLGRMIESTRKAPQLILEKSQVSL